jgi:hypothetical protein
VLLQGVLHAQQMWRVAAALLCIAHAVAADGERAPRLLVAMPTHGAAHKFVDASRDWRADVDSFVLTNGPTHAELKRVPNEEHGTLEVWVQHPDKGPECDGCDNCVPPNCSWTCASPSACGWCGPKSCRMHEQRYTSTPSLANLTFWGRYDWLLMADAETVFFADNVRNMVKTLDPSVPYYFSGSMYPGSDACCVFPNRTAIERDGCVWAPRAEPCTVATILDPATCASRHAPDPPTVPHPRAPSQIWNGGNWGLILSRGLMARISAEQWQDCVKCRNGFYCFGGGDVRIGECIWWHGFAPTLPDQDDNGIENERLGAPSSMLDTWAMWRKEGTCSHECAQALRKPLAINLDFLHQFEELQNYNALRNRV